MIIDNFVIKSYSRSELAMLYNPTLTVNSARRTLRKWIMLNKALLKELKRQGYCSATHVYTPLQVATIVKYLGAP